MTKDHIERVFDQALNMIRQKQERGGFLLTGTVFDEAFHQVEGWHDYYEQIVLVKQRGRESLIGKDSRPLCFIFNWKRLPTPLFHSDPFVSFKGRTQVVIMFNGLQRITGESGEMTGLFIKWLNMAEA